MKTIVEVCQEFLEQGKSPKEIMKTLRARGFAEEVAQSAINQAELKIKEKNIPQATSKIKFSNNDFTKGKHTESEMGVNLQEEISQKGLMDKTEKHAPWVIIIVMVIFIGGAFSLSTFLFNEEPVGAAHKSITKDGAYEFCMKKIQGKYPSDTRVDFKAQCNAVKSSILFSGTDKLGEVVGKKCAELSFVKSQNQQCETVVKDLIREYEEL